VIWHEAGHAVVSEALAPGSVSLVCSFGTSKRKRGCTSCDLKMVTDGTESIEVRVMTGLGGMAAVEHIFGKHGIGNGSDISAAYHQIEKQIDRIIAGLKLIDELKGVRFIREYGSHNVEMPIKGMLAVVSVTDTSLSKSFLGDYLSSSVKGEQYKANVEVRVYAPAVENGNGLSELVSEMLIGLKKADSQKIIVESGASPIAFDANMNAIYRIVNFTVEFCLCEEG
jgi:hypothetical protein